MKEFLKWLLPLWSDCLFSAYVLYLFFFPLQAQLFGFRHGSKSASQFCFSP